jgi:hypothetical protein
MLPSGILRRIPSAEEVAFHNIRFRSSGLNVVAKYNRSVSASQIPYNFYHQIYRSKILFKGGAMDSTLSHEITILQYIHSEGSA